MAFCAGYKLTGRKRGSVTNNVHRGNEVSNIFIFSAGQEGKLVKVKRNVQLPKMIGMCKNLKNE